MEVFALSKTACSRQSSHFWDTLLRKSSKGRGKQNYVLMHINCSFIYDSGELGINKMSSSRSMVK